MIRLVVVVALVAQAGLWLAPGRWGVTVAAVCAATCLTVLARAGLARPTHPRQGRLLVRGGMLLGLGTMGGALAEPWTGSPRWGIAAVVMVAGSVSLAWGMIGVARREGLLPDAAVGLESAATAVSLLVGWWALTGWQAVVAAPRWTSLAAHVYPLGAAALLAGLIVLLGSRRGSDGICLALVAAAALMILGDLAHGLATIGVLAETPAVALWSSGFAALAVAPLLERPDREPRLSAVSDAGVVLLLLSVVLPSAILVVRRATLGEAVTRTTAAITLGGLLVAALLVAARLLHLVRLVEAQHEQLHQTARTDELTGLPNRRAGDRILARAVREARRHGTRLTVAMIDLDHFKEYNDSRGHQAGDQLLRWAGRAWDAELADRGALARYGGEEFLVVLPDTDLAHATAILDAMRSATPRHQSFSAGLAAWQPGEDVPTLLRRVDQALYAAKDAGRARTIAAA
ncbi:diguanylate cyclase domain-containing protein [Arsenicicoccus dermatophilus]|uniref:GGDEF domain-containing protein n=1 Tax=Arsenicicoccus dermatophilus TaxID=1076331 RepID=UPI00391762E9